MNDSNKNFPERLLASEKLNQSYKQKYQKEVQEMLEYKFSVARRLACIVAAVICFGVAILVGTKAVAQTQILVGIGLAIGSLFNLMCAVLMVWMAIRGTVNLKTHPMLFAKMTWGAAFALMLVAIGLGLTLSDPITSIQVFIGGLVALIMAGVFYLIRSIDHAELKTREKLLEIEYRLAELSEQISKR